MTMKENRYGPQQILADVSNGDIFWDLQPFITYIAGTQIGCTIYVANPSTSDKEYTLMTKLFDASGTELLEESIPVFDHAWFTVEAGQFVKLHAELAFEYSNAILTVYLVEKVSDDEVDSVSTYLVAPTAGQLPPGFPGSTVTGGFDWSSMMMFMMMMVMVSMIFPKSEKETRQIEERKLLTSGR
jgi:hypothetical protein